MTRLTAAALLAAALLCPAGPAFAGSEDDGSTKSAQMHYLKGSLLEKRGAYAEALQEYEEALTFDPASSYITRETIELALEIGNAPKALQWALRLVELDPKNAQSFILMGRVRWAGGDPEAAEKAFQEALKLDPQSAESIFSLGNLLSAKSPEKARALLQRFLDSNPDSAAEALYQISKLDLQAGKLGDAIDRLKKAIELEPEATTLRFTLAQTYELQQSTDAALGQYLEILKLEPGNAALIDHIGEIYFMKGDVDEARRRFKSALAVAPADPLANHWLAIDAERQGDFLLAAVTLKASSALTDDAGLNLRLSYYLTQAGRLKEAVDVLEGASLRWPANDQIGYFLALGYDDLKMGDRAIKVLRKVLELKPDYRDVRYQLAVLLEKYGRMPEAEAEFRLLLVNKPDDASVLNYLGYSLADRGLKLDEAERLIREAVRLDPKSGAYRDSLGWVFFKQGRFAEAVAELTEALGSSADDETVWEHLGDAQAALGLSAEAWRAWKRAEAMNPPGSSSSKKAAKLQGTLESGDLGGLFLEHFGSVQGGILKLGALCEIKGAVLGQTFSYNGILTFRGPGGDLSVDLLGPFFTPMFRIHISTQGFAMDPLHVPGVKAETLTDAAYGTFNALRDYLSGSVFALRPARFRKSWRSQAIEVPGWKMGLDASGSRLTSLTPEGGGVRVNLDEFERVKGRLIPKSFTVSGLGYSLSIKMDQLNVDFR
ncbi:MAG: tetratricopeptide repeat protein [Elusimicrobiota bacterium]